MKALGTDRARRIDVRYAGLIVGGVLALASCGGGGDDGGAEGAEVLAALDAYCPIEHVAVEARIDAILGRLDLDAKVDLVAGTGLGGGAWRAGGLPDEGIPPLACVDGPRGVTKFAGKATAFPVAMARGATFDPELERRVGAAIAREVRAQGANLLLAPTMNVLRHPRWGRAQETYGEDPLHIGDLAVAFVEGAQAHVPVVAKHYAVNSIEDTRLEVDVTVDERTLREIYLPHFERVVNEAHVAGMMTAYNSVNGEYCSQNPTLVRDILKGEWRFQGFVVSDWLWGTHDTVPAALAGLDLEMPVPKIYGDDLADAVRAGDVDEARVDDMVRRILRAQLCHEHDVNPSIEDASLIETAQTRALAREVATRATVLLRNEGEALPLQRGAGATFVVTGPLADVENVGDTGSSDVDSTEIVTPLEGLLAGAGDATITHVAAPPATPEDEATLAAADAVIVVVGLTAEEEGEHFIGAGDRDSLALPAAHVAWIQAVAAHNDRVIVIVEGGGAITMDDFLLDVEAVLFAWYPGVEGGHALADLVFGDASPSGRLPITFPRTEADLPPFDNVSLAVTYGPHHGYRHLDHEGIAPLFPFGFGLGYAPVVYAAPTVSRMTVDGVDALVVTVDVTNEGTRGVRETVQVYVGPQTPDADTRYVRELRGHVQVDLAAGETKAVSLGIPVSSLVRWDVGARTFVSLAGEQVVEVGPNARDLAIAGVDVLRSASPSSMPLGG
jgi:beta-glucosidase